MVVKVARKKLLRPGPDGRLSEVLLGTLLTIAIAILAYNLNAQADHATRLRECEKESALHTERIDTNKEAMEARDEQLEKHFEAFGKRLERIENLLITIAPATPAVGIKETGGLD